MTQEEINAAIEAAKQEAKRESESAHEAGVQKLLKEKKELEEKLATMDEVVEKKLEQKILASEYDTFLSSLEGEEKEKFAEEYADLIEGKTISKDNQQKYLAKAYKIITQDEQVLEAIREKSAARALASTQSLGLSGHGSPIPKSEDEKRTAKNQELGVTDFAKRFGLIS